MGLFRGTLYSECIRRNVNINVLLPDHSMDVDPQFTGEPKVLYLLHGLGGNEEEWTRFSKIEYYAKKYNLIVIMPGVDRSFYRNTRYGIRYAQFIGEELPAMMNRWFHLNSSRADTFIAGESMGGYGAIKIGLTYPEKYAAIASLSGVVDYESFSALVHTEEFPDMEGAELDVLEDEATLIELAKRVPKETRPRLIQLCGTEDFLYEDNQTFRKALDEMNYGHTYLEGPGDHCWPYCFILGRMTYVYS